MTIDRTIIRDPASGVNQTGIRDHNERLVLSMIQRHENLSSAEIARRAGLSPQTVSVIIRALQKDGLLLRGEPVRGRVGKPSVPMTLNPDGAFAIGLKIGRRSSDAVLMDLVGHPRRQMTRAYPYPTPDTVLAFFSEACAQILGDLPQRHAARVTGVGIAAPSAMWNWLDIVRAPGDAMAAWRDIDVAQAMKARTGLDTYLVNDATAACSAEHVLGRGREFADYAYFFVGSFIGGGIVLNDAVYQGRTGNAGAFGSMPILRDRGAPQQLIHHASLYLLERRLAKAGHDTTQIWNEEADWQTFEPYLGDWIASTARHLAGAAVAAGSVIDFAAVLVDGAFPGTVRARLVEAMRAEMAGIDTRGIDAPRIEEGVIGRNARALGAAGLPIASKFFLSPVGTLSG